MKILISWMLPVVLSIPLVAQGVQPAIFNGINRHEMNVWVDSVMSSMTVDEKIGQLMIAQVKPSNDQSNRAAINRLVTKYHIGGLLYTKGTLTEQAMLTNYAQSLAEVPLMMTLDGEWGLSMRFTDAIKYPRNMVLGAVADDKLLYEYGREVARQCRRAGIQVNFAPVLDVNDNPENPVIGTRSYGENPEMVARYGIAYSRGLEDGGVLSVAKHFPGHGNSSQDSHLTLPAINKNRSQLRVCEFAPFKQYIDAGLSGMLMAHLYIPSLFDEHIPSSLSHDVVTGLLQDEMGFEGLIFTDGLAMKGVTREGDVCVKALLAGNDVMLGPIDVPGEIASIKKAVENGVISIDLLNERCRKILSYKYALGLYDSQKIDIDGLVADVNSAEAEAVYHKLWAGAITVVKNDSLLLPIKNLDKTRVAVLSIGGSVSSMFQERCEMYTSTDKYRYTDGTSVEKLCNSLNDYDIVVVAVHSNKYASVVNRIVKQIEGNVVAVMFTSAYDTARYATALNDAEAVVMAYDDCDMAQDYAAQTIFGGNAASGHLPVTIKGVGTVGTGISTQAVRLGYDVPENEGIKPDMDKRLDSLVAVGLKTKAFPGCQVLVARHGKVVYNKAFGKLDYESGMPVTVNTFYDLASVTKGTGTMAGVMKAYDEGKINIDAPLSRYLPKLPADKADITLRQLLYHESGLYASIDMYSAMIDTASFKGRLFNRRKQGVYSIRVARNLYGNNTARIRKDIVSTEPTAELGTPIGRNMYVGKATRDTIMRRIYNAPLSKNKNSRYGCLNFCLLMDAVENATGEDFDKYVNDGIFAPLGAYHAHYNPLQWANKSEIAPTEYDPMLRRQLVHGYVHDEIAAFSGGVQGNAGLFSNAGDLAKLCQMWLNDGVYGGDRYLKKSTVDLFCRDKSDNSRRGLGFDKPDMDNPDKSPTCVEASAATFGHIGFTGTCFWVDPDNDLIFIFLCNKINPKRENRAFAELDIRPQLFSIVYQSILKK